MIVSFQIRRGSAFEWSSKNPKLKVGEMGYEIGSGFYKIGDGVRNWLDLPYFTDSSGEVTQQDLTDHILAPEPHPVYDDGPSLQILYENAKV